MLIVGAMTTAGHGLLKDINTSVLFECNLIVLTEMNLELEIFIGMNDYKITK